MIINKRIKNIRKARYKCRYPRTKLKIKKEGKDEERGGEEKNQVTESINGFLFRLHV
jgi:hypothetical protein